MASQAPPDQRAGGGALAQRRLDAGLTMGQVGYYSGVGYAAVSRAERGHPVTVDTALRLAAFFKTTVEELFGGNGDGCDHGEA